MILLYEVRPINNHPKSITLTTIIAYKSQFPKIKVKKTINQNRTNKYVQIM